MKFTATRRIIESAYAFDPSAVMIQDWLIELLIGGCDADLKKLTRAQATELRECLAEHNADPNAWHEAWDAIQDELYV